MRVTRDGLITNGRPVKIVPAAVAERLAAAARWLTAAGQAAACDLRPEEVRPAGRGAVTVSRAAEERILRAADAAWAAAGHGAMPTPWRADALRQVVSRVVAEARGRLGKWGDELAWWLSPCDRVRPELAEQIGAVLRALDNGGAEEVLAAARREEAAAQERREAILAARREAAAACGPDPVPSPEEREALRRPLHRLPVPTREGWERRVEVGLMSAWVRWGGGRWVAHHYTATGRYGALTASPNEDSRGDGVGGPVGGGMITYGREYVVHITVGDPLPEDEQAAYAEEAERLYQDDVAHAQEVNARAEEHARLAAAYRARQEAWAARCKAAADAAERAMQARPSVRESAYQVLVRLAGIGPVAGGQ